MKNSQHPRKLWALLTVATASGLLIAGCTSPTPEPSGSGSPSATDGAVSTATSAATATGTPKPTSAPTVAPPTSDAEARAAATAVAKKFWALSDEIRNDGGNNPERINAVAAGQAAKDRLASAKIQQEKKITFEGKRGFEVKESYSSELTITGKPPIEYGFVGLSVCNDTTGITGKKADGSPADKGTVFRSVISAEVQYDPAAGKWFVVNAGQPGGLIAC